MEFLGLPILIALFAWPASAQMAASGNVPLVIVRFNQPKVHFEQQLYAAVAKAVAIKPAVMFDIITLTPPNGSSQAGVHTEQVAGALVKMGVPPSRIVLAAEPTPGLRYDEVHVYVR